MNDLRFVDILETDDAVRGKVRQWRNQDDVRKFMLSQNVITPEEHSRWLDGLRRRGEHKFWVIYFKKIPLGAAYLQNLDTAEKSTEWGFYIGESLYRGKGIGQQILFDLLEKVFDEMELSTLTTKVLSANSRAIGLYQKFNFEEMKRIRLQDDKEVVLFQFTKSDWMRSKEALKMLCEERADQSAK